MIIILNKWFLVASDLLLQVGELLLELSLLLGQTGKTLRLLVELLLSLFHFVLHVLLLFLKRLDNVGVALEGVFHLSDFSFEHHLLLLKLLGAELDLVQDVLDLVQLSSEIVSFILKFTIVALLFVVFFTRQITTRDHHIQSELTTCLKFFAKFGLLLEFLLVILKLLLHRFDLFRVVALLN